MLSLAVDRTDLVDSLVGTNAAVEAGAGFGKSVLLRVAAKRHDFSVATTMDEVTHRLNGNEAVVAVDDAERWSPEDLQALSDAITVSSNRRWIVAGRSLSPLLAVASWKRLGTNELRFDQSQIRQLLGAYGLDDDGLAEAVSHLSAGWPLAAGAIAARMAETNDPVGVARDLGRHNALLDSLLNQLVDLSSDAGSAAITLAALPFFNDEVADRLGGERFLDRLAAAGLPLSRTGAGRVEFLEPARTTLQSQSDRGPLPVEIVEQFVASHQIHAALDTCLAFGERGRAAQLLASLNRQQEAHLAPAKLHATVAAIGSSVEEHPRALFVHSHVSAVHGHHAESLRSIERGVEIFAGQDPELDEEDHVETIITLGVWRVFNGQLSDARVILERATNAINPSNTRLQAMLHDLAGVLHHGLGGDDDLRIATDELKSAYSLWRQLNEPEAATVTLFRLAAGVLASRGQRREALALLDDLPNLGPMSLHTTARLGLERALLLPYLGRAGEVEEAVSETKRISLLLDDEWTFALSLVAELVAASMLGDGDRVVSLSRRLVDERHFTFDTWSEGLYWYDVADALARCERWQEARAAVDVVQGLRDMPPWMVVASQASIEARCGDPDRALELLRDLELRDDVEIDRRWQLRLYAATAHRRAGRLDEAAKLLDVVHQDTAELGAPDLPMIVESALVTAITEGTDQAAGFEDLRIRLFGSLRVVRDGDTVVVPAGNTSTLLKLLASAKGHLTIDQVIEAIWPGTSLKVGRRRLRNVVLRLRDACGDVIERNGDLIGLVDRIRCDYVEAEQQARRSLQQSTASVDDLERSLALLDQPLLKDTPYEDWAEAVRTEQRRLVVDLLDRLAATSKDTDPASAIGHLLRANELDPWPNPARDRTIRSLRDESG